MKGKAWARGSGRIAAATQRLLGTVNETVGILSEAAVGIAGAARTGGVPLGDLSTLTRIPADDLQQDIGDHREVLDEHDGWPGLLLPHGSEKYP